jgi:hypothetical protein
LRRRAKHDFWRVALFAIRPVPLDLRGGRQRTVLLFARLICINDACYLLLIVFDNTRKSK